MPKCNTLYILLHLEELEELLKFQYIHQKPVISRKRKCNRTIDKHTLNVVELLANRNFRR